ncbi:MAG: PKD domain-containing protein, partial [Bacteroidetes bacterium]|nr:PKD domain-containing protein [Bacteroidota bacterium]
SAGYPPTVDTLNKTKSVACHGEAVSFTVVSSDPVNDGYWDWGDGSFSNGGPPAIHSFQDTGTLIIRFTPMYNGCPGPDVFDTIVILPPKPIFTANPTFICRTPATVTFTNFSWDADSWYWDFDDGTPVDISWDAVHTYNTPGLYDPRLVVVNGNGCRDSLYAQIRIPQPTAVFAANPTGGCVPFVTSFSQSSFTYLPLYSNIVSWNWNFGDGTNSSQQIPPPHTYFTMDTFTVTLIVTDNYGCKDTLIKTDYIKTYGNQANFTGTPVSGCAPLDVTFTDQSTSSSVVISWNWSFGDGSPAGTTQNPLHTYSNPGNYNVSLGVTDANGCTTNMTKTGFLLVTKPLAQYTHPVQVCLNENVVFSNTSSGLGITYLWNFGDGDTSSQRDVIHYYSDTGTFNITLLITDTVGCTDTGISSIRVKPLPVAAFTVDSIFTKCPPLVVKFTDLSTIDNDTINAWKWDFGDGVQNYVQNPVHTFSYPDTFDISLIVTSSTGCRDTLMIPDMVTVKGPVGTFTFDPDSGCFPLTVDFSSVTSLVDEYTWDFGDGVIDTVSGPTAVHTYPIPGFPFPQLSITDSLGCKLPATPPVPPYIPIDQVVVDFAVAPQTLWTPFCPPDTNWFYDSSYVINDSSVIVGWQWDFGDGFYDSVQNPWHVYSDTGTFLATLTATSSLGCTNSINRTIKIILNDTLVLNATDGGSIQVSCFGYNDGEATVSQQGGTAPFTYLWSASAGSQITATATGLYSGNHKVTITDTWGCKDSITITVNTPALLTATATATAVACYADSSASAFASASGGTPPYDFQWSSGQLAVNSLQSIIDSIPAGIYIVTITDSLGCDTIASVTVTEPPQLTATITVNAALCFGDYSGSAFATASGGTPPYDFLWSNGKWTIDSLESTIENIQAGVYGVTVTDSLGCDTIGSDTVTEPTLLTATATAAAALCFGDSSASAFASASGGTPPYDFLWSNGEWTVDSLQSIIDTITAGIYSVTVTDSSGCDTNASVVITEPPVLSFSVTQTNVSCNGGSDGTATATCAGGSGTYTYLWNDPPPAQATQTVTGLTAGTWSITITDSLGCDTTADVLITEPAVLSIIFTQTNVSCTGGNDATATAQVTGGSGNYTCVWDTPPPVQNSQTATGLTAGTWNVTVTDSLGCDTSAPVSITEPMPVTAVTAETDVSCYGGSDGTALVTVTGGSGTYTYVWNDPPPVQTDSVATGLSAGTWSVTITDSLGCDTIVTVTITAPPLLTATVSVIMNVSCYGGNTGEATANPSGGSGAYSYLWNDPPPVQIIQTATGLPAGTWFVTVTDSLGCDTIVSVIITEPPVLAFTVTQTDVSCNGGSDGSATAAVTGGTGTYSFVWNDPPPVQVTATATGLSAGTWSVTITDSLGCDTVAGVIITEPAILTITVTQTDVSCEGGNDGTATAQVTGGSGNYTYSWDDPPPIQISQTATGLTAGTWNVTVSDSLGCDTTASVTVTEPPVLTATATATATLCFGDSSASAFASASGGTPPYDFQWSSGQWAVDSLQSTVGNLQEGTYYVTITDSLGCDTTASVVVTEPALLTATAAATAVTCYGDSSASATASASGGTPPYDFQWSNGQWTMNSLQSLIDSISAGIYTVTVTDSNNCVAYDTITVSDYSQLNITFDINGSADSVGCYGVPSTVTAVTTGSAPPYTYSWSDGSVFITGNPISVTPYWVQTWTVTVTDSAGCTTAEAVNLYVNFLLVNVTTDDTVCTGESVTVEALTTGTLPWINPSYNYIWNTSATTPSVNVVINSVSTFMVTVSDGCSRPGSDTITIIPYANPGIGINVNSTAGCPPFEVVFSDTVDDIPGSQHIWYFSDGGWITGNPAVYSFNNTGYFFTSLTVTSPEGCSSSALFTDTITVYALPTAYFTADPVITKINDPIVNFTNLSSVNPFIQDTIAGYLWDFTDGDTSYAINPSHSFRDTGTFNVVLTVITQYGCTAQYSFAVRIDPFIEIRIPSAFTPNAAGSSGGVYDPLSYDNDVFYPITKYVAEYLFQIFNRWGELIFESTDHAVGWDGYYRSKLCQQDTYMWKLKLKWTTGEEYFKVGSVLLVR